MPITEADLKAALEASYKRQVAADHALDLFNPSADVMLASFIGSPTQRPFAEYFRWRNPGEERTEFVLPRGPCGPLPQWPIPFPCVMVEGRRGSFDIQFNQLFAGDMLWLHWHEHMGVHRMIGAILDDFVSKGRFPIRPTGISGFVTETMVREVKAGLSSSVRERANLYTKFGLDLPVQIDVDTPKNPAFLKLFKQLMRLACGYYNEKRLAAAIQNSLAVGRPSMATVTAIRDTIVMLRKAFDSFKYGRNHTHTLSGIVWTVTGLDLIVRLRSELGIPEPYDALDELFSAAYTLLLGNQVEPNRYTVHRDLAIAGRDILLDVQGLDLDNPSFPGPLEEYLELWLTRAEAKFETYRTAYRAVTGEDLGAPSSAGMGGPATLSAGAEQSTRKLMA